MIKTIKEYFELSKKEFNGMVVLCVLIFLIALTPEIYSLFKENPEYNYSSIKKEVDAFYASEMKDTIAYKPYADRTENEVVETPHYFQFNPNGLSEGDWKKLGLSSRQVKVIKHYEAKGGRFFKPEDLKRIYSISPADYARLEPYITIPDTRSFKRAYTSYKDYKNEKKTYTRTVPVIVELNGADSAQLESLKGIGGTFASRIIKYRKRLGGFVRKEQLLEVFGMDTVKYNTFKEQISVKPEGVVRLPINTASFEELRRFPYLSYKQINAILQYRKQHGNYASVNDLRNILILNDNTINKIAPYLVF